MKAINKNTPMQASVPLRPDSIVILKIQTSVGVKLYCFKLSEEQSHLKAPGKPHPGLLPNELNVGPVDTTSSTNYISVLSEFPVRLLDRSPCTDPAKYFTKSVRQLLEHNLNGFELNIHGLLEFPRDFSLFIIKWAGLMLKKAWARFHLPNLKAYCTQQVFSKRIRTSLSGLGNPSVRVNENPPPRSSSTICLSTITPHPSFSFSRSHYHSAPLHPTLICSITSSDMKKTQLEQ